MKPNPNLAKLGTSAEEVIKVLEDFVATIKSLDTGDEAAQMDAASTGPRWLVEAYKYEGLDEDDDNDALQEYLGVDPEFTPWCAAFANAVLINSGFEGTGTLRARDFAKLGEPVEGEGVRDGSIAVFQKHVGFVVEDGQKLLGGNQGNKVKTSNLAWYHGNMKFLGYRWPTPKSVA